MPHTAAEDIAATIEIQSGALVSKVIYRDEAMKVTLQLRRRPRTEGAYGIADRDDPRAHGSS
jgi:hypothetical protein